MMGSAGFSFFSFRDLVFQQRQICILILSQQLGIVGTAVMKQATYLLGFCNNMPVTEYFASG